MWKEQLFWIFLLMLSAAGLREFVRIARYMKKDAERSRPISPDDPR